MMIVACVIHERISSSCPFVAMCVCVCVCAFTPWHVVIIKRTKCESERKGHCSGGSFIAMSAFAAWHVVTINETEMVSFVAACMSDLARKDFKRDGNGTQTSKNETKVASSVDARMSSR